MIKVTIPITGKVIVPIDNKKHTTVEDQKNEIFTGLLFMEVGANASGFQRLHLDSPSNKLVEHCINLEMSKV